MKLFNFFKQKHKLSQKEVIEISSDETMKVSSLLTRTFYDTKGFLIQVEWVGAEGARLSCPGRIWCKTEKQEEEKIRFFEWDKIINMVDADDVNTLNWVVNQCKIGNDSYDKKIELMIENNLIEND